MDIILLSVNNPNASNMTFFRFTPKNNNGVTGADAATTSAKILTVQPEDKYEQTARMKF